MIFSVVMYQTNQERVGNGSHVFLILPYLPLPRMYVYPSIQAARRIL